MIDRYFDKMNIFRLIGDMFYLLVIIILLIKMWKICLVVGEYKYLSNVGLKFNINFFLIIY